GRLDDERDVGPGAASGSHVKKREEAAPARGFYPEPMSKNDSLFRKRVFSREPRGGIVRSLHEERKAMDLRAEKWTDREARALGRTLAGAAGWSRVYADGAVTTGNAWIVAGRSGLDRKIAIGFLGKRPRWTLGLKGVEKAIEGSTVLLLDADHATLVALRDALPFLQPRPTGKTPSFGFGDRTGMATPGHLLALEGSGFFPNLAQQSIREMTRTQRTPADVLDAAVFGALQSGHLTGFGADAAHLKTLDDVDRCADARFVSFTLDAIG